jgi:hypothetical protein
MVSNFVSKRESNTNKPFRAKGLVLGRVRRDNLGRMRPSSSLKILLCCPLLGSVFPNAALDQVDDDVDGMKTSRTTEAEAFRGLFGCYCVTK